MLNNHFVSTQNSHSAPLSLVYHPHLQLSPLSFHVSEHGLKSIAVLIKAPASPRHSNMKSFLWLFFLHFKSQLPAGYPHRDLAAGL